MNRLKTSLLSGWKTEVIIFGEDGRAGEDVLTGSGWEPEGMPSQQIANHKLAKL